MATTSLYKEKELLQRVAAGDEAAYKILFQHYWDPVYAIALLFTKSQELSEDMTQDVFARIWVHREKMAEVEKFESYLFIMARNTVFNRLRKEVYVPANVAFLEDYFADSAIAPDDSLDLKEVESIIQQGIRQLPRQQQKAFQLSRFQGLTHQQIAREMGISKLSVKSHIVRAMQSLRKYLEEQGDAGNLATLIWMLLFL